jgi:hypothetical protein
MNPIYKVSQLGFAIAVLAVAMLTIGSAALLAADSIGVILSGNQEAPPVNTAASASGTITVGMDQSVSGSITTQSINGTMAHIHEAAPGTNGAVIVALTRTSDNVWSVPPGVRLNDNQYRAYKAGNLYINVHSDAYPNGEIRAQLTP